jgi:hypothetical protein
MDSMLESGALLTLDDNNNVKIIESKIPTKQSKFRNIYGTLNTSSEDTQEVEQNDEN